MKLNKKRAVSHTIINLLLISMIVLLNYVMGYDSDAIAVLGRDIQYRTQRKDGIALECVVAWDGKYVDDILDTLKNEDAKASFVLSGNWTKVNSDTLKKIVSGGHYILTCGMNYDDTERLNHEELVQSIKCSKEIIESMANISVTKYYCPISETAKANKAAMEAKLDCVRSTFDLLSARGSENEIVSRAKNSMRSAAIVAFTPTQAMTKALPKIIELYRNAGFDLVGIN